MGMKDQSKEVINQYFKQHPDELRDMRKLMDMLLQVSTPGKKDVEQGLNCLYVLADKINACCAGMNLRDTAGVDAVSEFVASGTKINKEQKQYLMDVYRFANEVLMSQDFNLAMNEQVCPNDNVGNSMSVDVGKVVKFLGSIAKEEGELGAVKEGDVNAVLQKWYDRRLGYARSEFPKETFDTLCDLAASFDNLLNRNLLLDLVLKADNIQKKSAFGLFKTAVTPTVDPQQVKTEQIKNLKEMDTTLSVVKSIIDKNNMPDDKKAWISDKVSSLQKDVANELAWVSKPSFK